MFELSDIYIGNFPQTQGFGENPAAYAQFGLKGHNGIDIGVPTGTKIISTAPGKVIEIANDTTGYGRYVKVLHNGFFTIYCHLQSEVVKVGDTVIKHQLVGLSDNTGNSTGPHLHFGVAPCDTTGKKTEPTNGYAGYINPNGVRCHWTILNPSQPATGTTPTPTPTIPPGTELIKTTDLIQLRYREQVLQDVCNYLNISMATVESAPIIKRYEDLKAKIANGIKALI